MVADSSRELLRTLDWKGAFWVAAGVPPLMLFALGGVAGLTGSLAYVCWAVSMGIGFVQCFTYAEIASMFSDTAGGVAVSGGLAWLRYSKLLPPLSVWCNWLAWSPVLSLGCSISSGYILNAFFPIPAADSQQVLEWVAAQGSFIAMDDPRVVEYLAAHAGAVVQDGVAAIAAQAGVEALTPGMRTWQAFALHVPYLGWARLNSTFVIGTVLILLIFVVQYKGIASTAWVQRAFAVIVLVPLLLSGLVPVVTGAIDPDNISRIVPPTGANTGEDGEWDRTGWTLFLGGLYLAAYSTYAFETAACYTAELKNPKTDTFKAIFYSGLFCTLFLLLIPFSFQGVLGQTGLLQPSIIDGTGVAAVLGDMVAPNTVVARKVFVYIFTILMILALFLTSMTALACSSRMLYQGSCNGWLPKYLSHVNSNGAPTLAIGTDFAFNLMLLLLASDSAGFYFVISVANAAYLIFTIMNLHSGWIHRIDSGHLERPWKAPAWLIAVNTFLAYVNAVLLGAGAKLWGYSSSLWVGLAVSGLIVPLFLFRHYVQDKGHFPKKALDDLGLKEDEDLGPRKAGLWPYLALLTSLGTVLGANWIFALPG